jgi:phosphatidylglycerophosphatase A
VQATVANGTWHDRIWSQLRREAISNTYPAQAIRLMLRAIISVLDFESFVENMKPNAAPNAQPKPTFQEGMRLGPVVWVATGLGLGFSPWAPGTVGGLWGLPLAWAINHIPSVAAQVAAILVLCAIGIPICQRAAEVIGRKDPGSVVWDEIVGLVITFFLIPAEQMSHAGVLLAGFLLFRFFDISKISPAKQLERYPAGWGIMADDWVAGVYSCLALHLLRWLDMLP